MNISAKKICITAVLISLTFIFTRFVQIPIPLGYINLGNAVILLSCILLPMPYGLLIGGLGSALADLTSYPIYTLPTLIIKLIMPLAFYALTKIPTFKKNPAFAAILALIIPVILYFLAGCLIYGSFAAGLTQLLGLAIEYLVNLLVFILLHKPIKKIKGRL